MKTRTLGILALVTAAVVAVAVAAVVWRESETRRTVVETELFAGLIDRINEVAAIEIAAGDDSFRIARAGDAWVVPAKADFPARFDLVRRTLIQVGELKTVEAKTADPARHAALGLVEPGGEAEGAGVGVRLLGADDAALAALVVGERARGGRDMVYVRRAGEDQTWLARSEIDPGEAPMDWLDSLVVQLPFERIQGGAIRHADGEVITFAKDSPDAGAFELADLPEGATVVSPLAVDSLARAIAVLRFDDVDRRDAAAVSGEPDVRASYRTFDGITVAVSVWAGDEVPADAGDEAGERAYWARIDATYDPADATVPAEEQPGAGDEAEAESGDDQPSDDEEPFDAAAEAARLAARTAGWAFKVPEFKGEQFTMRLAELIEIAAPEPAAEPDDGDAASPADSGAAAPASD